MGRVIVDSELVTDAVLLGDLIERDPERRGVANVVVEVVTRCPPGHRALFDPVLETSCLRLFQQRDEALFEVDKVLIHRQALIAADEAAHRRYSEQNRRIHRSNHELVFLGSNRRVLVKHVVEVGDIGDGNTGLVNRCLHPGGTRLVEGLAKIESVRYRIEHRFGRHVGHRWMEGGG